MATFSQVIAGIEEHLKKAEEHHRKLRRQQDKARTHLARLDADIQTATQTKLLLEMNLQVFRQTEWEAHHPAREAGTQVRDFQLPQPPSMTLPIVFQEPPTSPDAEPQRKNFRSSPAMSRKPAGNGRIVAVVQGYSRCQRAFIDNDHRF